MELVNELTMFVGVVALHYQHHGVDNGVPQLPQTYSPLTSMKQTMLTTEQINKKQNCQSHHWYIRTDKKKYIKIE